jgi:hypothetical protein
MGEDFVTFQKFNDQYSAKQFGKLLSGQNIKYVLENNSLSFDPTFANNSFGTEYCIKIKNEDFEKVNAILEAKSEIEISEIDKDYYLLSFSDEELIDVIAKSDEWNKFDVSLAKKLLRDRGKEITSLQIEEIKKRRIAELSKPEKSQEGYIILGYITALLGGLLGIFVGWHLLTYKKTLPDGNRVYVYSEKDRKQGNRILILGSVFFIFWFTIKILLEFNEDL